MESASSHTDLAAALSKTHGYTVYIYDRRGRGSNPSCPTHYTMATEISDLSALLSHTNTRLIFGISSGALIALQAILQLRDLVKKAVLFEPVLSIDGSVDEKWVPRYEEEMREGRLDAAMVTAMKGTEMGPGFLHYVPRSILQFMTRKMFEAQERSAAASRAKAVEKKGEEGEGEEGEEVPMVPMKALAPKLGMDIALVREMADTLETFKDVKGRVLLMGGDKSAGYLKVPLPRLKDTIEGSELVMLEGLNHGASGNAAMRGNPGRVAEELAKFFGRE